MKPEEFTLQQLVLAIDNNHLLLPQFQREFDWDTERQKSLLLSFLYNIPTGNILLLKSAKEEIGTKTIGYKESLARKDDLKTSSNSISYLMDGQQRLTTLKGIFDDFFEDEISFDNVFPNLKHRWFLKLNIFNENKKIEETSLRVILEIIKHEEISDRVELTDIKELIVCEKILKSKKSNPFHPKILREKEYIFKSRLIEKGYFPLFLLLPITKKNDKNLRRYKKILESSAAEIFQRNWFKESTNVDETQKKQFIEILGEYNIKTDLDNENDIEELSKDLSQELSDSLKLFLTSTSKRKIFGITYEENLQKAVAAFYAMNTGGLPLSTFDIISAKYSALRKSESLRERIKNKFNEECEKDLENLPTLKTDSNIFSHFALEEKKGKGEVGHFFDLYLNMLNIYAGQNSNSQDRIKEKSKLLLKKEDIDKYTDKAVRALALAFRFLAGYCGVLRIKRISYRLMVLPIASALCSIYDKEYSINRKHISAISYWYWSSLFGGRYREKQNSRSIEDISNIEKILEGDIPDDSQNRERKIFDDEGYSDFDSLKNGSTAKLKDPILQFVLINGTLGKELKGYNDVVKELASGLEEAHLISRSDYNNMTGKNVGRGKNQFINSPLNLALLSKNQNRNDNTKSWYNWPSPYLEKINRILLIPKHIKHNKNECDWGIFGKEGRDLKSEPEKGNQFCESFFRSRFEKLKESVKIQIKSFKEKL